MRPSGGRTLGFLAQIPVGELRGCGPGRDGALAAIGISSVLDLLSHYPFRYHDQTRQASIADLEVGQEAWVLAEVVESHTRRTRNGRRVLELQVRDGEEWMTVVFFNQPWRSRQLPVGTRALFFGRLQSFRAHRQLTNPRVEMLAERTGRLVPIYPSSEKAGIESGEIARLVGEALERAGRFADPLTVAWREALGLVDRTTAYRDIHRPGALSEVGPARRRLAFDELLRIQLEVVMRRQALERSSRGIAHLVDPAASGGADLVSSFLEGLPFEPTCAQRAAIEAIRRDMAGRLPMHRLLQGDVGSGKTVVALAAMLVAVQGGYQAALMAPTEVLAEQHLMGIRSLLDGLEVADPATLGGRRPLRVELLANRVRAGSRRRVLEGLDGGDVEMVVGTHALLGEGVSFERLGVVVIDEQHRFGVDQRAALREKAGGPAGELAGAEYGHPAGGADPDVLVMTATPIPRTAAMVVFGDLDITVLGELPAGRARVETRWVADPGGEELVWERVRSEVAAGHRAYVVCPLVEGSERVEARSAVEELERLQAGPLAGLKLGLLHGRLDAEDKERVMSAFRRGSVEVLVATTVIEVGVDVPEATVMVVEDSARFGIAQLHQLRGRVGRSNLPSWCFLLGGAESPVAEKRLAALEATTDGFELAEVDLELRGEGSILGARQQGRSDLKLARLDRGARPLVEQARWVADEILRDDPFLSDHSLLAGELRLFLGEEAASYLFKS